MRGTEFAELTAFAAIVEHGSFAKAAIFLGCTTSTLSQTMKSLECRVGARLLNRTTRRLSLTDAGARLLAEVKPALDQLRAATDALRAQRNKPSGTLRLSASSIPAQMVLEPIIGAFLRAYPDIVLDIVVDTTPLDLAEGRFDAALRHGWTLGPDMVAIPVTAKSRSIALASPGYLKKHPSPQKPQDLRQHSCICMRFGDTQQFRWSFEKNGEAMDIAVKGSLILNNAGLIVAAIRQGVGIGYLFEDYVRPWIEKKQMVPVLQDWSPRKSRYYLYYASRQMQSPALKAFVDFLKASRARD